MRWEDERYVRVYTRDTPEWSALSWEARAVFWGLLRRCDRAGILQVGKAGLRALAGVIPAPLEVVERAVPELLADGCLQAKEGAYFVPNFMTAQEAVTTDAQRKRDQRERDRARIAAQGVVASPSAADKLASMDRESVTKRDELSRHGVTLGHEPSREVTASHSVPSRAVPKRKKLAGSAPADPRSSGDATYKAMVDAMYVLFRQDRGVDLESAGRDWKALQRLREKHEAAEIIRRWGIGVRARYKARCSSFTDLEARWNDCGAPEAGRALPGHQVERFGAPAPSAEEIERANRESEEWANGG